MEENDRAGNEVLKELEHLQKRIAELETSVSDHKQLAEELRDSEERYRLLYENAGNAIFTIDPDMKIMHVNKITCDMLGCINSDLVGKNISETAIIHPDDQVKLTNTVEKLLDGAGAIVDHFRLNVARGSYSSVEIITGAVRKDGKITAIYAICCDTAGRERIPSAVEENDEKYRTLLEHSHDGIYVYCDNAILLANDNVCEHSGYRKEELLHMSVWNLLHPEDRLRIQNLTERERGVPKTFDARMVTKTGDIRYCRFVCKEILFNHKNAILAIVQDFTDRKNVEDELHESLDKLQQTMKNTLQAMAKILEIRDPYTAGHQQKVAVLTLAIAREMRLPEDQSEGLHIAALIHDIGKIYVPAEILNRPSELSDAEFALLKTHPKAGYDILKNIEFAWPVAEIVLQHHERLDGSGYPQGLKNGAILLEARILGVADVIEAMLSHRPYRPTRGLDTTLEEMAGNKGVLYDARVVDVCLKLFVEKNFKFD